MVEFKVREPIGSSTFPMPDQTFNEQAYRNALNNPGRTRAATVYIHIPFCDQICSFCGFNKMVSHEDLKAAYVEQLLMEIQAYGHMEHIKGLEIGAVYLGGGTPNALNGVQLYRILKAIEDNLPFAPGAEITCEGTPQNFDDERIAALLAGGTTRVSAGIQTFNAGIRSEHLNMTNGKEELLASIARIKSSFPNFNLDMIYNLTGQTAAIWNDDLETAISTGPAHMTAYPLVLLEKTILYKEHVVKGALSPPDQDEEIALFDWTVERLAASPFTHQYSVRDWAQPGQACRYITLNAQANHVIAFGAGAHGFAGGVTYRNIQAPQAYIAAIEKGDLPVAAMRISSEAELMQRHMVMGLRLRAFDLAPFRERFGRAAQDVYADKLQSLVQSGYIEVSGDSIAYTAKGDIWANNVRTFFEDGKAASVGYTNTLAIGATGKDHYSAISRVKASADIEAA